MFHKIIGTTNRQYDVKFVFGAERFSISSVNLLIKKDGEAQVSYPLSWECADGNQDLWSVTIGYMSVGLYEYTFTVNENLRIGRDQDYFCRDGRQPFQLTVYEEDYCAPTFLNGGIIYQIMVDRFCAVQPNRGRAGVVYHDNWEDVPEYKPVLGKILNNDFFGGNLKGIQSKLDYFVGLGVTCLYLSPIFEAASNHKYDTADYLRVDPSFGTEADLKDLVESARQKGISVVLDGVFSHTGDDSIYFNKYGRFSSVGAYQSEQSPYYDWYTFSHYPDRYDSWWGISTLPEVKETCPSYLEFITGKDGVLAHWMRLGIAGWRLDVADELPDLFLDQLTARVKQERSDALVLGEVWEDASNKVSYGKRRRYFQGKQLDSVTNYVFRAAILQYLKTGDARALARGVQPVVYHYPPRVLNVLMNVVGTHDTPRMLTMLSGVDAHALTRQQRATAMLTDEEYDLARKKLFIAAVLQYTLPGVPCVFYGDEVGMQGHEDPFNRRTYPWGKEDQRILRFYQKLGKMRAAATELKEGTYRCLHAVGNVFIFERRVADSVLYVGVNVGNTPFASLKTEAITDAFTGEKQDEFVIPPMSYAVVREEKR